MERKLLAQDLLNRIAPLNDNDEGTRVLQFSKRMAKIYQNQIDSFDDDEDAKRWREFYSVRNMPPPGRTKNKADVAAQIAFYFPTHYFKFQNVVVYQMLEFISSQRGFNPYPFGATAITLIDIGAGTGAATMAILDLLATWADILAEHGYKQLGLRIKVVTVEPDRNKDSIRRELFTAMASSVDRHMIDIESSKMVGLPYPDNQCIRQIHRNSESGPMAICYMSNLMHGLTKYKPKQFVADRNDTIYNLEEIMQLNFSSEAVREVIQQCGVVSRDLIAGLPHRKKLFLSSEVESQGTALQEFASAIGRSIGNKVRPNRVRFINSPGSYWYTLQNPEKIVEVDYWSLAHLDQQAGSRPV